MGVVQLILVLVLLGIVAFLVNKFVPMEAKIKEILNIVFVIIAVVLVLVWVLSLFGFIDPVKIK